MRAPSGLCRVAGLCLALALVGGACSGDEPAADSGATSTTGAPGDQPGSSNDEGGFPSAYASLRRAYAHMYMTGDGLAAAIDSHKNLAGEVKTRATDLRVTLDRLLAEHALLAGFAMQKGLDGAPDFQALADALEGSSEELAEAVGSVYGEETRNAFLKQWREQIPMLVDLTVATTKGDENARRAALDDLAAFRIAFSEFMSRTTGVPAGTLVKLLGDHVGQLTSALDAYKAKDHSGAYVQIRLAYAHMFATGDALAGAIDAQKDLPGETRSQAADLRVTLDGLLGEHSLLMGLVMQKGFDEAPDFIALAEALDKNSVALAGAAGAVYGDETANAFLVQWREHIRMFVDLTKATKAGDTVKRDAALDQLSAYRQAFAELLATTTGDNVPAGAMADLLEVHIDQLTAALDAYAAAYSR